MTRERNPNGVRRIAALLAVLLVYLLTVTAFHYTVAHEGVPIRVVAVALAMPRSGTATHHAAPVAPHASHIDCALCDWAATPIDAAFAAIQTAFVTLSAIAALLLFVRVAALCAAPAPRRGLRAPPVCACA